MLAFRCLIILLSLCFEALAQGSCTAFGVDYINGQTYNIDQSSNEYFTFTSRFQGCTQETINPVLVSPEGNQYACSSIETAPHNRYVTSRCGIPFSAMASGDWRIVLQGSQLATQRTIHLIVGRPETVIVTATPTVVMGITSTPSAVTDTLTIVHTQTLILPSSTITQNCNTGTQTVTSLIGNQQTTTTSTLTRTETDGQRTSYWTTTATTTATCHYPTSGLPSSTTSSTTTTSPQITTSTYFEPGPTNTATPTFCIGRGCWRTRDSQGKRRHAEELEARDTAAEAAVAATTITVTQTTTTFTHTIIETAPPRTTTETKPVYTITTVSPPPRTVCDGQARPTNTVTTYSVIGGSGGTVTQIVATATHLSGTVWVGQTQFTTVSNSASASACWRAGGWYGR